ncbi:MAG: hypothetical protein ACAH65_06915, partial [Chloroflexota bacterium]
LLARVGIETERPGGRIGVPVVTGPASLVVEAEGSEALLGIVPTWRRDIEIEADLAEEIARVRGYELVPATIPDTVPPEWRPSPLQARDAVREALVGAGATEFVTHALVSPRHLEHFTWTVADEPAAGEGTREGGPVAVTNPLSADHAWLRQSLVGSLADAVSTNLRRGLADVAAFEVGKGYGRVGEEPREWWRLGLALAGSFEPASWNRPERAADIDDAKGLVELLARLLRVRAPKYAALTDEPILHPGRSARVTALAPDGSLAISGLLGELHPRLIATWELRTDRLIVAELSIAGLSGGQLSDIRSVAPPRFPPVERDIAVVVGPEVPAEVVAATIVEAGGPLLQDAGLFDLYRGGSLGPEERSLAYRLHFGAADRTLTEDEVDAAVAAIVGTLEARLGARLRS